MKTENAFALKNFDAAKILQRPFFKKWREDYHVGDETDEKILMTLAVKNSDDVMILEKKNRRLNEVFKLLDKLRTNSINHSNNRLESYRRALTKKLANADTDFLLKSRYQREQGLALEYVLNIPQAIADLMIIVEKIWQDSEQALQAAYRRRFGERLKIARERTGLSRKELGDAINISPNGYGLYETGKRDVSTTALIRLARTLNVSADWLIGLTP